MASGETVSRYQLFVKRTDKTHQALLEDIDDWETALAMEEDEDFEIRR